MCARFKVKHVKTVELIWKSTYAICMLVVAFLNFVYGYIFWVWRVQKFHLYVGTSIEKVQ